MYNIPMSWGNFAEGKTGEPTAGDWLPEISDYGLDGVVCVAGKNPNPEKVLKFCTLAEDGIGCPNLVPVAMIAAKPEETIGKRRYQPNLDAIRCRLGI